MNTLIGQAGIKHWNSTWKHHHVPVEFKKRIRVVAIREGTWKPNFSIALDCLPWNIFDHWGSFIPQGQTKRQMASMPYSGGDEMAKVWAEKHGINLIISENSPYGHGTRIYIFKI
jgi:hypothetical protein